MPDKEHIEDIAEFLASRMQSFYLESRSACLFGGDTERPLVVEVDRNIRAVKVKLPRMGCLNFKEIKLFTSEGCRLDMSSSSLIVSSIEGIKKDDIDAFNAKTLEIHNSVFGLSDRTVELQTSIEAESWLIIEFEKPVSVGKIELHAMENHLAKQCWLVDLDVSPDGLKWNHIHSQILNLEQHAKNELSKAERELNELEYKIYSQAVTVLQTYIINGTLTMYDISSQLEEYNLSIDEQACVKFCINSVLKHFQVEIAAHGVTRSYRFWTLPEKQAELEHANQVVEIVERLIGDACLGFGSCLGAVREGDFIPHDDDMDIIVHHKEFNGNEFKAATENMMNILLENGIDAKYDTEFHIKVSLKPGKIVDVFCGLEREGKLDWHPGKKGVHKRADVFPGVSIPFLGIDSVIPKNAVLYLERVYGTSWRIPMPFFDHYGKRNSSFSTAAKAA